MRPKLPGVPAVTPRAAPQSRQFPRRAPRSSGLRANAWLAEHQSFLPARLHMVIFRFLFFSKITGGTKPNLQNVASFQSHRGRLEGFSNTKTSSFPLK